VASLDRKANQALFDSVRELKESLQETAPTELRELEESIRETVLQQSTL